MNKNLLNIILGVLFVISFVLAVVIDEIIGIKLNILFILTTVFLVVAIMEVNGKFDEYAKHYVDHDLD